MGGWRHGNGGKKKLYRAMSERKCHTNKINLLFPCLTSFLLGRNLLIIPFIKAKYVLYMRDENVMDVVAATPLLYETNASNGNKWPAVELRSAIK